VIVGTVREIKDGEHRVALTPAGVSVLAPRHRVLIESGAGENSGFSDDLYRQAGATVRESAAEVWAEADLVVKVKEPLAAEFPNFRQGSILFTYLHLAAAEAVTRHLMDAGVTSLAYELVRDSAGRLPLLAPMSEVAGSMAGLVSARLLMKPGPARGKLPGGVAGVPPARAVVVGAGTVGRAAARSLIGAGANVTMVSLGLEHLRDAHRELGDRLFTRVSSPHDLAAEFAGADIAILGVLVPGASAPKIVTREMVRSMGPGAVLVDVSIDQGGAAETSHPTSHSDPTYVEEGVIHYCVTNMPGAVPNTSTIALTSATLPHIQAIADLGIEPAMRADPGLAAALSTIGGNLVCEPVASALNLPLAPNPFL
jgi:alanine dehydrogenase